MKKQIILIALLFTSFVQANPMQENSYNIIFNDEDSGHQQESRSYNPEEIEMIHGNIGNQEDIIKQSKEELFAACIKKSSNLINILDDLKELPTEERVISISQTDYWNSISEEEQTNTLLILYKMETITDKQYIIVKGQIANKFKEECFNIR